MIIGIDEVGRGCWAGPLVAGAVALPDGFAIPSDASWRLADSKLLSRRQRQQADAELRSMGIAYGLGWVTAAELDGLGMTAAVALAMGRAYEALPGLVRQATGSVIIDGAINYLPDVEGSKAVIKADGSVACVSAASILAKVARDSWMAQAAEQFPGYGFEKHVGYGTRQHMEGLAAHGVCTLHRRSFKPVARYIEGSGAAT